MTQWILVLTTNSKEFFVPRVTPICRNLCCSLVGHVLKQWDDKLKNIGMTIKNDKSIPQILFSSDTSYLHNSNAHDHFY